MRIEVAYAKPEEQVILRVEIHPEATAQEAILHSGLLSRFPEIDLERNKIGLFSKPCKLDQLLKDGDRVEIYRPLIADPKESRRNRAVKS
jgi:putative ubiquitin-RnfH superfamily antitoxin RatB of RatAB toxin-antitoxin module